jgi:hypothetical protein
MGQSYLQFASRLGGSFVIAARSRFLPFGLTVFSPHILLRGLRTSRYHEDAAF